MKYQTKRYKKIWKMPIQCAIEKCPSAKNKGCKIHFYKFPLKVESLLRAWIQATNRNNWMPTESSRICELHFKLTDFFDNPESKRKLLKADTILTENLSYKIDESTQENCAINTYVQRENIKTDCFCSRETGCKLFIGIRSKYK